MDKKRRKKMKESQPEEGKDWTRTTGESVQQVVKKDLHSTRKSLPRPSQKNLPLNNDIYNTLQNRNHNGFIETTDTQPPPAILHLAPSEDFSMVSNITNPSILNQSSDGILGSKKTGLTTNSEELYHEVRARSKK
jgi:hypothetical protein